MHVVLRSLQNKYRDRAQTRGDQIEENRKSLRRHLRLEKEARSISGRDNSHGVEQKQRNHLV